MTNISENLQNVKNEIDLSKVRIIAVTKYVDTNEIIQAYRSGIRDFGENKVQDAERKMSLMPEDIKENMIWHFIGHLQSNKVKKVVGVFDYIHSVDSVKLAWSISEEAKALGITQKILIQVNTSNEETKFGYGVDEIKEVFTELLNLDSLNIVGFMTMAPFTEDTNTVRDAFKSLRELRDYLQAKHGYSIPELSMGMSNDFKIAVQEGATMIRLGQILFK